MKTFDPSHEYVYVKGEGIDAKHPNGDIDRIKTTGDHAVGEGFLLRGEPLVYVLNAIYSLTRLNVIQTYYSWSGGYQTLNRYDTTIRYTYRTFTRRISADQINRALNVLRTDVIPFLCKSDDAPIAKANSYSRTENYLDANPSLRVDPAGFRTHEFAPVKHLTPPRKEIIKALVADVDDIMDGSCILVTGGITPPSFLGWSPHPSQGRPNDCILNSLGGVVPDEELGTSYMSPCRTCYEKNDLSTGEIVLVNYEIIPIITNRFSVRMYNAAKSLFNDGATRRHVSITAIFKIAFLYDHSFWFPVKMTESPIDMASIQSDVFSGIFETYAEVFGAELPSRDHKFRIGCVISDVNLIVKLSKTRQ